MIIENYAKIKLLHKIREEFLCLEGYFLNSKDSQSVYVMGDIFKRCGSEVADVLFKHRKQVEEEMRKL